MLMKTEYWYLLIASLLLSITWMIVRLYVHSRRLARHTHYHRSKHGQRNLS